jgi:hypothetical protein|uniref:Uncharacterized protein n=1 Tax=viral metagenome TaxID=1070528 RepID=A0A6C0JGE3_9ZZZZ
MEIKSILLVFLIILVVYLLARLLHTSARLTGLNDAKVLQTIDTNSLSGSSNPNMNFTYSIWMYIDDWNYKFGEPKTVLSRLDDSKNPGPSIVLNSENNTMDVILSVYPNTSEGSEAIQHKCNIDSIPLQKWVNVMVTLYNKTLDVYIDGKLVRSCLLPGVPRLNNSSTLLVTPNGGFSGQTSGLQYWDSESEPQDAWDIYKKGWSGNFLNNIFYGLSRYGVKVSLMSDGQEESSVEI